jgi:hypothetical protein
MCSMLDFEGSANGEAAIPSRRCGSTPRLHLDIALRRLRRNPGAEPPPLDRLPDRGAAVNLDAPGASHPGVVWRSRTRVYRSYILWNESGNPSGRRGALEAAGAELRRLIREG